MIQEEERLLMEQSELRVDVIDLTRLAQIKVLTKVNLMWVKNMATLYCGACLKHKMAKLQNLGFGYYPYNLNDFSPPLSQ